MCIDGYDPAMGEPTRFYWVRRDPSNLSYALGHMLSWSGCRQGEMHSFLNLAWCVEETKISLNCAPGWKHWSTELQPVNER